MNKSILALIATVCVITLPSDLAHARTPRSFLPLSLSYAWPGGGLSDQFAAQPALGFSLGYMYGTSNHFHIGATATWMRMSLGQADTVDYSSYGLTHIGMLANIQYRFLKHGWTPYVRAEGGMGIMFADKEVGNVPQKLDDLTEVKFSYAGVVGVQVPVSEVIDIDVAGRYQITFVTDNFSSLAAHVGIVYTLQ